MSDNKRSQEKVIIVGNSPSILLQEYGELIDSYDVVIRVNKCVTEGFEKYIDFSCVREGQDIRYAISDEKLQSLGWKTEKKFDEELPKIVEYYKNKFIW